MAKRRTVKAAVNALPASVAAFRGPVADPAPGWGAIPPVGPVHMPWNFRGPVADPAPWMLLDRDKVALIKVRQLDGVILEVEKQLEILRLERDLLKAQYKIR